MQQPDDSNGSKVLEHVRQEKRRSDGLKSASDELASRVSARLRRSGYPFFRGIKCEVRDGITVLSGTVPSFRLKQLAQELAAHTPGVRQLENSLHVTGARLGPDLNNLRKSECQSEGS